MRRPGHDLSWRAIRRRRYQQTVLANANHKSMPSPLLQHSSRSLLANITNMDDQLLIPMSKPSSSSSKSGTTDTSLACDMNSLRADIHSIMAELKFMTEYIRREEEEDDTSQDWKFAAMVIDRLCLIFFAVMTSIFTYLTLFSAPNFFLFR